MEPEEIKKEMYRIYPDATERQKELLCCLLHRLYIEDCKKWYHDMQEELNKTHTDPIPSSQ